jgi:hypothetical protein
LHGITNGFGVNASYVYDGKAILFTTAPVNLQPHYILEANQLVERAALFVRNNRVRVEIRANAEYPIVDLDKLGDCLVGDVREQADRTCRSFLELVTSQ